MDQDQIDCFAETKKGVCIGSGMGSLEDIIDTSNAYNKGVWDMNTQQTVYWSLFMLGI